MRIERQLSKRAIRTAPVADLIPRPVICSLVLATLALAFPGAAGQAMAPPQNPFSAGVSSRSYSGQFIVQRVPARGDRRSRRTASLETDRSYITLDATVLPVSCERIKQALGRQLGGAGTWSGRICLALYKADSGDDPITITSTRFSDGWQYQLELPDLLDRTAYVRGVVDVLLLEIANRHARDRSAEIPAWLSEGLCQELLFSNETEIILPPPRPGSGGLALTTTILTARKEDPLATAHRVLCASVPLTFQQLSWPEPEQLEGQPGQVYRSSSQLFLKRLVSLPDGSACLRAMLAGLPDHYNWQFAFLQAFRPHFQRPLDVEKWWALHLEHFTGRDLSQTWPAEESWGKLGEVIHQPVQVYPATTNLARNDQVKLQTIIRDWDRDRQIEVLQGKLVQLEQLRLRLAPPFLPLVDEYRRVLNTYLERRDRAWASFAMNSAQRRAAADASKELDRLDSTLAGMRPATAVPKMAGADPGTPQ